MTTTVNGTEYQVYPLGPTKYQLVGKRGTYIAIERGARPGEFFLVSVRTGKISRYGLRYHNGELRETEGA